MCLIFYVVYLPIKLPHGHLASFAVLVSLIAIETIFGYFDTAAVVELASIFDVADALLADKPIHKYFEFPYHQYSSLGPG